MVKFAKPKFYITTPIYYVNDVPHIGHAYTTIAADILARWKRSSGYDVFFLTGTDEHGLKIQRAAERACEKPKQFVDALVKKWRTIFDKLNISYDDWIRTTDPKHEKTVQEIIKKINSNGDIYRGKYKGEYCVGCEKYLVEDEIVGGLCKIHKKPVEHLEEETYFFKMSKYAGKLAELYKKNPQLIQPKGKLEEIRHRILTEGLKDLSITRTMFDWGVPFPLDKKYVVYVWIDALTNYISALGWPQGEKFKKFWPADVHLMAKDILWFHTVLWHSMLLSAGIELPKVVFAHGWWTVEGEKMSKSLGNVVDPVKMIDSYGADSFRYYIFREIPFGEDGDFSERALITRINTDLANSLGNLVSRTLTLIEKFSKGKIPKPGKQNVEELDLNIAFDDKFRHASAHLEKFEFHHALDKIWEFIAAANKYVNDEKPWELAKTKGEHLPTVLYNCAEALRIISALICPFMPETAEKIAEQLGIKEVPKLTGLKWGGLKPGIKVKKGKILFEKIEETEMAKHEKKQDFPQLHIRVGKILEVEDFKEAKKPMYKVKADFGPAGVKWTFAGLKPYFSKAQLKGKLILGLLNLAPKKIADFESQFLTLAAVHSAKEKEHVELLTVKKSKAGDLVYVEGEKPEIKSIKQITMEDFIKVGIKPDNKGRVLHFGKPLKTDKEEIKVGRHKEAIIR